ncbi:hypothetical protein P43SY_000552 [Pythium insidiosum]|uniref:RCK N-terminal domain-containing protein n=1 Tax=Pythium insidiosum TaxID=114742 RepID=A0AAD5M006_PYTIN|nr:hypothetical protein P43SY_000552 [Pythium insidiosum]
MQPICRSQFASLRSGVGANASRSDPDGDVPVCIADWTHTKEQLLIAAALWLFLLVISATWTFLSRRQRRRLRPDELGFSLRYRKWAGTSRTAAVLNRPVQLLTSLAIFGFMLNRCSSYQVSRVSYYCMTALYLVAIADDVVRFLAARYKVLYCFHPLTLLEILMVASHFQVGFGSTQLLNGVPTRAWLDLSIMRPIFILRSYLEMERHVPRASRGWMMLRLAIKVLLLIVFGASAMFFLETLGEMPFFTNNGFAHLYSCDNGLVTRDPTECESETWSVMFSFYFTVVTLGTVGYGDNAPKTVLSRLLAIMFIVMGVILFSMEIENLISLYRSRQIGNPPYHPRIDHRHVIIMGNPSFAQLSSIIRELLHDDHIAKDDKSRLHVVVLGDRSSKFTKGLVTKLGADPIFAAQVTYVAGNPTRVEDLERAKACDAEAVFVFPDKLSDEPAHEDAVNIMRVLATRRYCGPNVRCLAMVLRAESARHMRAAGLSYNDIICENKIKMGTFAQSATTKGFSTMLANLAASLSVDTSDSKPEEPEVQQSNRLLHAPGLLESVRQALKTRETMDHADVRLNSSSWENNNWLKDYYRGMQCYVIADDLEHVGGISDEEVTAETIRRPDATPTILRTAQAETFVDANIGVGEEEEARAEYELMSPHDHKSSLNGGFAAAVDSLTTFVPLVEPKAAASQDARDSFPAQLRRSNGARVPENVIVDRSLRSLAFNFNQPPNPMQDLDPEAYYMRGSPLVYADLQRAGAKAAAAVIVLGKHAKTGLLQSTGAAIDIDIESSIVDAEAIFTTMLIELKMDFTKIFTITELTDESNSKYLGTTFQLTQFFPQRVHGAVMGCNAILDDSDVNDDDNHESSSDSALQWWEYLLLHDAPQHKSGKAIFGMPLYMSGRVLHPELCENMLVQTFYNPSIHKILRQLVGGPSCTGVIRSFRVPKNLRVIHAGNSVQLPIVLTTPRPSMDVYDDDEFFVLIGVHTLARAAIMLQRFYRKRSKLSQSRDNHAESPQLRSEQSFSPSLPPLPTKSSFMDPRARIAKYLAPKQHALETMAASNAARRSLIAQESSCSFRSFYV